jgi:hypothetical protein
MMDTLWAMLLLWTGGLVIILLLTLVVAILIDAWLKNG